jgi:MFS family permease
VRLSIYVELLRRSPGYTRLWLAQVVSLTGDWFSTIVLSTLIAQYSDGSGFAISLFLMARFLPSLLFSPFAGVIVDRFDRRRILIYSNALRVFVVLGFLLADSPDRLWVIYALTIIQFTLSTLFEPGQSAITPSLVRRDDLVTANTIASITWSTMLAFGALIGGVVSAIFGPAIAIVIDAATFAVAALIIASIRPHHTIENAPLDDDNEAQDTGSFMDGLRFLRKRPATIAAVLVKGSNSIGNVDLLITIFATQIFIMGSGGTLSLGIMYSAFGIGAVMGPLIANRFHDGSTSALRNWIAVGFFFAFIAWFGMGAAGTIWVLSVALIIRAMGGSVNWTYSVVLIQKSVPDRYLGRVFSLDLAFFQFATVVSTLAHGIAVDAMTPEKLYEAFGRVALLGDITDQVTLVVAGNPAIPIISFATAVVAFFPMMMWFWMLNYVKRRDAMSTAQAMVQ